MSRASIQVSTGWGISNICHSFGETGNVHRQKLLPMTTSYLLTGLGFVLVTVIYFGLMLRLLSRALVLSGWDSSRQQRIRRNATTIVVGWALLLIGLGASGFAGNFEIFPVNAAPILIVPFITIAIVVLSPATAHLLTFVPQTAIINLQTFRLFVEVMLWALFAQDLLPVQMTFEGRNFDILVALTAPFAAWWLAGRKWALIVWNVLGLCLLINIVSVALLSMPTPFRVFNNEPANRVLLDAPFIFLPGMLVPLAYGLHFLSLRKALRRGK
jgi:hypothetical protein